MIKLQVLYKGLAQAQINQFPELYFVKKTDITVQNALQQDNRIQLFHFPLSVEAFDQLNIMQIILQNVQLNADDDLWVYIWGTHHYSSVKAYKFLIGSRPVHPIYNWLWYSSCQLRHKVFFWLLLKDRVNTRGLLKKKNMVLDSYTCELCIQQKEESLQHLFLHCSFARNSCAAIGIHLTRRRQPLQAFKFIKKIVESKILHGDDSSHVLVYLDNTK